MFIAFEGCPLGIVRVWGLVIETIRKLACEEFIAVKHTWSEAQKHSKGFIYVYFL